MSSKKIQESCCRLEFTRQFLDETNMGYSTDAVNFIIEVYCPWNFYHVGVNYHLSPASFPDYLATVSKSNHLKLIKYNLQRNLQERNHLQSSKKEDDIRRWLTMDVIWFI